MPGRTGSGLPAAARLRELPGGVPPLLGPVCAGCRRPVGALSRSPAARRPVLASLAGLRLPRTPLGSVALAPVGRAVPLRLGEVEPCLLIVEIREVPVRNL
eukprot:3360754-Alexandrium_andersonii.AAC.1